MNVETPNHEVAPIEVSRALSKDLREASMTMTVEEARYVVDAYYQMQDDRVRWAARGRSAHQDGDPSFVLSTLTDQSFNLERMAKISLDAYSSSHPIGIWLRSITGIGPVLAAGFIANIDVTVQPSPSHLWSFAGLNPNQKWRKGQERPWNARLKRLCWLAGESFVKSSGSDTSFYGPLYRQRKDYEIQRNESGGNKETAAQILKTKNFDKTTSAYKALTTGRLPDAQIHARARRWATKMFLAHLWEVWRTHEGLTVVSPYAIAHQEHVDKINPPNWPMET